MGTRSIPLTTGPLKTGEAQASLPNPNAAGLLLAALTLMLAAQTGSFALSLALMLLPAPALLILRKPRALLVYGAAWTTVLALNALSPELPALLRIPVDAGHSPTYSLITHACVLGLFLSLLAGVGRLMQKDALAGQEASTLLERLNPQHIADLSQRPRPVEGQRLSPAAQAFNAHADHLVRLVSAFQMLRNDMKELSAIAARLRQKAAVQKERSDLGADQVGRLYENNDTLSTRAEAIAQTARGAWDSAERILETTRQYEDDIRSVRERVQTGRDNIDRLFNQLVQVKAAMTAARTMADKMCALGSQIGSIPVTGEDTLRMTPAALQSQMDSLSTEIQRQFLHMETTIEELTGAIYNSTQVMTLFQEKVEMSFGMTRQITRSTQALQEENASTAAAIEDLVVQMHNSQRKAMDLLSSLEFARNASQEAIAVIENSAHHIVRSETLVEEIDRELVRIRP